ncbi:hypothetical protein A9Q02_09335 [Candidatus Chloroploca asiatica]|uniref:Uncharacterized protein n=2 Tax=Candidatus Chloroploca asiatica TaxID=1506545 RepID=A0A2H3L6G8_9CHLR|nr:hypothetical protein A9Q02_09335 [Candidatus Chloroploca asiatica]
MTSHTIHHPIHGSGVVIGQRFAGFELHVRFSNGRERYVRADEVQAEAPAMQELDPVQVAHPTRQVCSGPPVPRGIIETLRLGIVPENRVQTFTFGRDAELAQLQGWLTAEDDGARIIQGTYGTGKTHILNYLRRYALKEGYAVAFIEMDTQESPFSRPKRVYSQVAESLTYRDALTGRHLGFKDLVRCAVYAGLTRTHPYFSHLETHLADEAVWNWIMAREDIPRPYDVNHAYNSLPGLYNHGTAANIYTNLLSGLGWFCQHPKLSLKGLILIFDESETLFGYQTRDSSVKSFNFLDTLLAVANNDPWMLGHPQDRGFITSSYAWNIPFLYQPISGLKLALAFTSLYNAPTAVKESLIATSVEQIVLQPLDEEALYHIFEKVRGFYRQAYCFKSDALPLDVVFQRVLEKTQQHDSLRMKIKGFVEALDLLRLHPGVSPDEVLV